jgi:hypothetical protein
MLENIENNKTKDLRNNLENESKLLHEQMELPLNGDVIKNAQSDNNLTQLSKGVALSRWIRKLASQFESVDPFYK